MACVVFWGPVDQCLGHSGGSSEFCWAPLCVHIPRVFSRLEKAGMIKEPWLAQFCIIDFLTLIEDFL